MCIISRTRNLQSTHPVAQSAAWLWAISTASNNLFYIIITLPVILTLILFQPPYLISCGWLFSSHFQSFWDSTWEYKAKAITPLNAWRKEAEIKAVVNGVLPEHIRYNPELKTSRALPQEKRSFKADQTRNEWLQPYKKRKDKSSGQWGFARAHKIPSRTKLNWRHQEPFHRKR